MIRVHVICEGQSEEMFVNEILTDAFRPKNIHLVPALIGKPGHKGGNFKFERLITDVRGRLLSDKTAYCTTLFDFYGLPNDFPGKAQAEAKSGMHAKADCLLAILKEQLQTKLGAAPLQRFIPYVQMYEFEALLFSHPDKLAQGINQTNIANQLRKIKADFASPEDINNNPNSAPSKRIEKLFPAYDKPIHGTLAALEIGLNDIRQECQRFAAWLNHLEALSPIKSA